MISVGDMINAHFEENIFESRTLKKYIHTWGHSHQAGHVPLKSGEAVPVQNMERVSALTGPTTFPSG
jgi:hypothetical protein